MKTIGIIGGVGPQATMDFEARLHRVAQQRIAQHVNSGYPPAIVYYHRRPPILLDEKGKPRQPVQIDPELAEALRKLGPAVDFLVIASNTPHLVQKEIEEAAGRPVLSMVEGTLDEVGRRKWKKVGVIGLGQPIVYTRRLDEQHVAYETLPADLQARLDAALLGVMEGRQDARGRELALEALETLRRRGVDGIILGCTELPLLLDEDAEQPDLINPVQLLAEAAIERATR